MHILFSAVLGLTWWAHCIQIYVELTIKVETKYSSMVEPLPRYIVHMLLKRRYMPSKSVPVVQPYHTITNPNPSTYRGLREASPPESPFSRFPSSLKRVLAKNLQESRRVTYLPGSASRAGGFSSFAHSRDTCTSCSRPSMPFQPSAYVSCGYATLCFSVLLGVYPPRYLQEVRAGSVRCRARQLRVLRAIEAQKPLGTERPSCA